MKKQEYLTMLGWDILLWTVLLASEVNDLLTKEDATGNIFPIADPGGVKAFGEGAYVAKIEWYQKHTTVTEIKTPQPPILDGPTIPAPPKKDDIEDAVIVDVTEEDQIPDVISPLLRARLANLVKAGWDDDTIGHITSPDDISYPYVNVEEMENTEYSKLIKAKPKTTPKKETPVVVVDDLKGKVDEIKVVETKPEIMEPNLLLEERLIALTEIGFVPKGESSVTKGDLTLPHARIVSMPDSIFDAMIKKFVKTEAEKAEALSNKVSETKNEEAKEVPEVKQQIETISGDGKESPSGAITKEPIEVVEQQAKDAKELQDADVEKAIDKVVDEGTVTNIVPTATVDTLKHFKVADDIIELATAFKKTFYAIALIKTVMAEDLTPSKKMAKVKAAVKNIDTNE